jgi:hypothetical protein
MSRRMTMKKWDALTDEQQAVWWLWLDVQCWIGYQCEMLMDPEHFQSSLPPLPSSSTLVWDRGKGFTPGTNIVFRSRAGNRRLHVFFDADLLSVRYRIDGEGLHEVLAMVRNGEADYFETPDGTPLTACGLTERMIGALTTAHRF